jgi:thiamine biosynthesis protein ThiS
MTVFVCGHEFPVEPGTTVLRLLAELGLSPRQVAVERNRDLVPRAEFVDTRLAAADRVEVVVLFEGSYGDPTASRPGAVFGRA